MRVRLALRTLRHELGVEPNGRSWHVSTGATCSWLSPGFELVEGLGGLGKGVGDALVPVHVAAPRARSSRVRSSPRASVTIKLIGARVGPNDPDRPHHAAAGVSKRRHANAALQGIDLQGDPHTWLSPGIDGDTSGMSARYELRGFVSDPPWKRRSIRAVPAHAGGCRLRDPLASGTA